MTSVFFCVWWAAPQIFSKKKKLVVDDDWLQECDYHFILTHPHQGNPRWDCCEVYEAMNELADHPGFPHKSSFTCPVFRQHKFRYLCAIPEIVNPTLAVPFPQVSREYDRQGNVKYISHANIETFRTPRLLEFQESVLISTFP